MMNKKRYWLRGLLIGMCIGPLIVIWVSYIGGRASGYLLEEKYDLISYALHLIKGSFEGGLGTAFIGGLFVASVVSLGTAGLLAGILYGKLKNRKQSTIN